MAERLYQADSSERTFKARVADIREYARNDGQSLWQLALDRTAFYPTSGGQPFDRGTLIARSPGGAELVAEIEDVVEDQDGEIWHATRKPLPVDAEVTGALDWPRRLDHMQQHSGQHLLSAVFFAELSAPTISFHLGEQASTIDLAADTVERQAELTRELSRIELRVNERIAENLPVSWRTVNAVEAEAMLADGRLTKLPAREGPIRVVEIAGLDQNACGGTHVSALGQIGCVLLRATERTRKGLRVEFLCGLRAVHATRTDWEALSAAAGILSVGRADTAAAAERLLAANKQGAKQLHRLKEELAQHHAVQLAIEERVEHGLRLVARTFADHDASYVKLLASRLVESVPQTVALLLSTMAEPATIVLAASASLQARCGARMQAMLVPRGLRGGGSPDLAQATLAKVQAEEIAKLLRESIVAEFRKADPA